MMSKASQQLQGMMTYSERRKGRVHSKNIVAAMALEMHASGPYFHLVKKEKKRVQINAGIQTMPWDFEPSRHL